MGRNEATDQDLRGREIADVDVAVDERGNPRVIVVRRSDGGLMGVVFLNPKANIAASIVGLVRATCPAGWAVTLPSQGSLAHRELQTHHRLLYKPLLEPQFAGRIEWWQRQMGRYSDQIAADSAVVEAGTRRERSGEVDA